jgi:hypothetical protein
MTSIMRVRVVSTGWQGAPGLNTFYFQAGAAGETPAQTDANLCHTRVRAGFDAFKLQCPVPWTATVSPTVDVLNTETGDLVNSFSTPPTASVIGTAPLGFMPTATMILLRLNTSTFSDGSRIQGRAFLGPVALSDDADGTPTVSMNTAAIAMGEALQDAGIGGVPIIGVWRRPRLAAAGPPIVTARAGSFAAITSITSPDKFAVLRSRRD